MRVVSMFDGISCGMQALKKLNLKVEKYYSFEIDKYAIAISENNHPEIERMGSVVDYDYKNLKKIDLLMGGSPCQGFSFAGKQLNFSDPRSKLFFEFVAALKTIKPKYFLLENVKMKKEYQDIISSALGVEPFEINSALFSAQNRRRLYWTNIPFDENIEDKGIVLKDVIEEDGMVDRDKSLCLDANYSNGGTLNQYYNKQRRQLVFVNYSSSGRAGGKIEGRYYKAEKAQTLTGSGYGKKSSTGIYQINPDKSAGGKQPYMQDRIYHVDGKSIALTSSFASRLKISNGSLVFYRKLTVKECERLQTLPDNYTLVLDENGKQIISDHQRYKALGNGWTLDVIAHILKGVK